MAEEKAYKKVKIVDSILQVESAGGDDLPVTLSGEVVDVDVITPVQLIWEPMILGKNCDDIIATYPTTTQEVYTYKLGATTVRTITINYTDATKNIVSNVTSL